MIIAISGPFGSGKTTLLGRLSARLGARVVTLPSPRVVPGLPPDAPARPCRDAAMSLGLVRGRLALLADCCAQVERDRAAGGTVLYSCCALDTAAHQGEPEATLRLCGDVRPDLVIWLDAEADDLALRLLARDGVVADVVALRRLVYAYDRAARVARSLGWRAVDIGAGNTPDEVEAAALAAIGRAQ